MKRIIKSNNKLNNKGFTLVEVLIAMSVLVIVSIPMLDTLSGTSVMTRRSSTRQRATLLAQSITEGIKRYSTLDLCKAFVAAPGTKTFAQLEAFPVLNIDNYSFEGFERLDRNVDPSSGRATYTVNTKTSENAREYYFGIFGIEEGIERYDALITLTPETYSDLNAEVIPEIVNIGAPGTGLIDITGVYNGKDFVNEFIKEIESDDYSPRLTYDPDNVKVDVEIFITKHEANPHTGVETSYEVYGSVWYRFDRDGDGDYNNAAAGDVNVGSSYVGSRSLDAKQGLNYVYILLGDDKLARFGDKEYKLKIHVNVRDGKNADDTINEYEAENIPIAIVTGSNDRVKWDMTVDSQMPNPNYDPAYEHDPHDPRGYPTVETRDWRDTAMFFTNAKNGKINFRNHAELLKDYGTSGNKLKRIYGLRVDMYDFNFSVDRKFQGDIVDSMTSSYLRIDVDDFNSQISKAE